MTWGQLHMRRWSIHRKHRDTPTVATTVEHTEAVFHATDPSEPQQRLRNDLARILGVDPETLHPDKGRRADA